MSETSEMRLQGQRAISRIVGARLTSVQFVLNYLILGFDEKGALTTLVWPELINGDKVSKHGMRDYRNDLCELIEQTVQTARMDAQETILITFSNGSEMRSALASYALAGDRAILTGPEHYLFVF